MGKSSPRRRAHQVEAHSSSPSLPPSFSSSRQNSSTLLLLLLSLTNRHLHLLNLTILNPRSLLNQLPLPFIPLTKLVPPHLSFHPFLLLLHHQLAQITNILLLLFSLNPLRSRNHLRCSRNGNQLIKEALSPLDQREQERSLSD